MEKFRHLFALICLSFSLLSTAQETTLSEGYIADDLFIYMHSGAGTNYRIIGTIIAGSQVQVTGEELNNYSQIIDEKGRTAWVESKYVSDKPGLRFVVAELNSQLAGASESESSLNDALEKSRSSMSQLREKNNALTDQLTQITNELSQTKAELKSQDTDIQKEWFYNGAIVLGLGLLLGLVIPKLSSNKKSNMNSWT